MAAIRTEKDTDGVVLLTFDQPNSRANILTRALWEELSATLSELEAHGGVTGLVLASAKPDIFIAGADLKFFAAVPAPNDPGVRELVELGLSTLEKLESLPFPTCAAIDGAALGGGLEVALACDHRVVGTNPLVELGLPEVGLGLIPGWGGTQRLPRIVGLELACDMLVNGRSQNADQSRETGLVNSTVKTESLVDFATREVLEEGWEETRFAKRSPMQSGWPLDADQSSLPDGPAVRELMKLMTQGPVLPLAEALKLESAAFLRLAGSEESKRLIAEFFAARKKPT